MARRGPRLTAGRGPHCGHGSAGPRHQRADEGTQRAGAPAYKSPASERLATMRASARPAAATTARVGTARRRLQRWIATGRGGASARWRPGRLRRPAAGRAAGSGRSRSGWPRTPRRSRRRRTSEGPLVDHARGRTGSARVSMHVGEVDGLAPRRGPDRGEGHVDEQHLAVADQEVGGLDVAMGEPTATAAGPRRARCRSTPSSTLASPIRRPREELGHEEVLPLRGDLHEPVRWQVGCRRRAYPQQVSSYCTSRRTARRSSRPRAGRSSTVRPSLYHRSERRWVAA